MSASARALVRAAQQRLGERLAGVLSVAASELDARDTLRDLGLTPPALDQLLASLGAELGVPLPPEFLTQETSIEELAKRLARDFSAPLQAWLGVAAEPEAPPPLPPASTRDDLQHFAENWLLTLLKRRLESRSELLGPHIKFAELGMSSVQAVALIGEAEAELGAPLAPTLVFDYPNVASLASYVAHEHGPALARLAGRREAARTAPAGTAAITMPESESVAPASAIAVIGLACRFPEADDAEEFWQNLRAGRDCIREVPKERFDLDEWYDPDPRARSRTYCRFGGWLRDIDQFDAEFFRISPREAETMAPQQRLLLEVAWHALEHAGYAGGRASERRTGVFVGVIPNEYALPELLRQQLGRTLSEVDIEPTLATGEAMSIIANRLSYIFNLSGPSLTVDTACSSSLVATHLASQSLLLGECDIALAAGVNVGVTAGRYVAFSKARMFAPNGRCKPFDAGADGYVCGEGVGVVVLKRLDRARADGDRILAVIRGSAVNQDGATNGLTAPSSLAQQRVLEQAFERARVSPASVTYYEAHGTGTALGDPLELRAAADVFERAGARRGACGLGSVKSNVGHLEGAAGIAALIKVILALSHHELPPTLHFTRENPLIKLAESPFYLVSRLSPWSDAPGPRRACMSSFGFGGTNCHLVLEAPAAVLRRSAAEPDRAYHLLALSAASPAGLDALIARYRDFFARLDDKELADACFTANVGHGAFTHRASFVARSCEGMSRQLAAPDAKRVRVAERTPRVAFLFTGQGAQYAGMAEELYRTDPTFRVDFDRCTELARPHLEVSLTELVFENAGDRLHETRFTQPATFAIDYCMARFWLRLGLKPAALIGHSLGELAAACVAGVIALEDALPLVVLRGQLMQEAPGQGAMAAVLAPRERIDALISAIPELEIAARNGPKNFVLSGPEAAILQLLARAADEELQATRLAVSHGFHSRLMEPILPALGRALAATPLRLPQLTLVSNRSGRPAGGEITRADYWLEQLRHPVEFALGVEWLLENDVRILLEVGPGLQLSNLARAVMRDRPRGDDSTGDGLTLASLVRGKDAWESVLEAASQLWLAGVALDFAGLDAGRERQRTAAPHYPFQRRRHWLNWQRLDERNEHHLADSIPATHDRVPAEVAASEALLAGVTRGRVSVEHALGALLPGNAAGSGAPSAAYLGAARRILDLTVGVAAREILIDLGAVNVDVQGQARAEWLKRTGISPLYHRLVDFLLTVAREDGLLRLDDRGRLVSTVELDPGRARALLSEAKPLLASCAAEITLLERCLAAYSDILRGKKDPLAVLFPNGDLGLLTAVYRDAPVARRMNERLAKTVCDALVRRSARGKLRVLEIGAGTGGSSAMIIAALRPFAGRVEYHYTDLVPSFLNHGRAAFGGEGFVSFGLLDIERSLDVQGQREGGWDVIVAAHVLHATRDLRLTLENARRLLAPDGMLAFIETLEPRHRWMNCIFGLTSGWWRFDGRDGRTTSPLLDAAGWSELLRQSGFQDAVIGAEGDAEAVAVVSATSDPSWQAPRRDVRADEAVFAHAAPSSATSSVDPALAARTERFLCQSLAKSLRLSPDELKPSAEFRDIGLDSILAQDLLAALERVIGKAVGASVLFEVRSIRALATYLVQNFGPELDANLPESGPRGAFSPTAPMPPVEARPTNGKARNEMTEERGVASRGQHVPIAVIGYASRIAGTRDAEEFWQLLRAGGDAIQEIPEQRWPLAGFYSSDADASGRSASKWAGLVREPFRFDSEFFRISKREALAIDPQQRLLLETSWEALEHAGYAGEGAGRQLGVFVGASTNDYAECLLSQIDDPVISRYFVTGTSHSFLANRLSFLLGASGPSLTLDTACSSSLVALHLACSSLKQGDCEMALVSGVNLCLTPTMFVTLSKTRALSPTGRCRTFSDDADGYVRSEGAVTVLLKPLDRAIADGDCIHAVILGSAVNHAGQTNGATVPNPDAQRMVIRRALELSGVEGDSISYVECHGTGTRLGDPIEIEALSAAHARQSACPIGSVKSNVGHLEAASGLAGFLKTVLALEHGEIPASINVRALNPLIHFESTPFFVNQSLRPWTVSGPRRAGVSSFGLGGTNCHVVLEAAAPRPELERESGRLLLALSARSPQALAALADRYCRYLGAHPTLDLFDLCWTAAVGRQHQEWRAALVFADRRELSRQLGALASGAQSEHGLYRGRAQAGVVAEGARGAARDLGECATDFVRGALNDLVSAFGAANGRRIPLPSYPFEDSAASAGASVVAARNRAGSAKAASKERSTTLTLSASDVPFADHRVAGKTIFPGVGWVYSAYRAAPQLLGESPATLRGVSFLRPLELAHDVTEATVSVSVVGETDGLIGFEIRDQEGRACASGHFGAEAVPLETSVELFDFAAACPEKQDIDVAYQELASAGFAYGPRFQTLRSLRFGEKSVFAELRAGEQGSPDGLFAPGVLDGAFQACGLLATHRYGGEHTLFMPFHIGLAVFRERLPERVFCLGELASSRELQDRIEFNLKLVTAEGRVLAELEAVSLKKVPRSRLTAVAQRSAAQPVAPPRLYRTVWRDVVDAPRSLPRGRWLIVSGSDASFAEQVRASDPLAGSEVFLLSAGTGFRKTGPDHYELDPLDPAQYRRLLEEIGPLTGILHLADAEHAPNGPPVSLAELDRGLDRHVFGLLGLLQAVVNTNAVGEFWYFGGEIAESGAPAAAVGLVKTLSHESSVRARAVLLGNEVKGAGLLARVVDELGRDATGVSYWVAGRRVQQSLDALSLSERGPSPFAGLHGSVLIAGGASGIGLEFARVLLAESSVSLVLVHRSPREAYRKDLEALDPTGTRVTFVQADVTELEAMRAAAEAARRLGPLRGVIQSTGVLRDRPLRTARQSDLKLVMAPKVHGTWVLNEITQHDDLAFFYVFSSISALFGNAAQAGHVAANAYERALAAALARAGRPMRLFTWGVWGETGSVAHPTYLQVLRDRGIRPMRTADAMAAWRAAAQHDLDDAIISEFEPGAPRTAAVHAAAELPASKAGEREDGPPLSVSELARAETLSRQRAALTLGPWVLAALDAEREVPVETLRERLNVPARFQRLFGYVLELLAAEQVVVSGPRGVFRGRDVVFANPEDIARTVRAELPKMALPHAFLERCLNGYVDALSGRIEPLSLLFPNGSADTLLTLYGESPLFAYFNARLRAAIAAAVAELGRSDLRVVEIGAGTGSCTSQVLEALRGHCAEYYFTDISPAFLRKARARFADAPFMRFGALDVSRPLDGQGFAAGSFDIVVAGNVLHATRNLMDTLRNVNTLLRPGGRLAVLEVVDPGCWGNLIFGLTDGWWLFDDVELRPKSACVSTQTWRQALEQQGFGHVSALTPDGVGQVVLTATRLQTPGLAASAKASASGLEARLFDHIEGLLAADLGHALDRDPERIDRDVSFAEFGLDSLMAMEVSSKLSKKVGEPISPAIFFDHPSVRKLARYLGARHPEAFAAGARDALGAPASPGLPTRPPTFELSDASSSSSETPRTPVDAPPPALDEGAPEAEASLEPIAVIGIACRFPGADEPRAYWDLLESGASAISQVPPERWSRHRLDRLLRDKNGAPFAATAGFLRVDPYAFDALTFRTSPAEAKFIDPQQRLFAEVAWETLEDAAYGGDALTGREVGVFVGASSAHYHEDMGRLFEAEAPIDPAVGLGNANAVIANRTSYLLNLCGPSITVDTLCSSSLVAVHLAVQSIRRKECELALAGGVHLHLSPSSIVIDARLGALSSSGVSRTFDAAADGFATGEGAGAVLLKPLHRALADGDHIYAVIRGSATIHGGRSNGLAAPNGAAQERIVARALEQAEVEPGSIGLVEAHGAATPIGDPVEIRALTRAYRRQTEQSGYCAIGSVKTNFGHLEAAAGVAGLMKVILALKHRKLPPSLNFDAPNPLLELSRTPFYVPTSARPWPSTAESPRRAAVSSFGLGGVYAHVVLEEAPPEARSEVAAAESAGVIVLSARTETALAALIARLAARLGDTALPMSLADIGLSLNQGRTLFPRRVAFVARDRQDLVAQLAAGGERAYARGVVLNAKRPVVVLDCGGDDDTSRGLPSDARARHPALESALLACDVIVQGLSGEMSRLGAERRVAAFSERYALAKLCLSWGVAPSLVVGQGVSAGVARVLQGELTLGEGLAEAVRGQHLAAASSAMPALPKGALVVTLAPSTALEAAGDSISLVPTEAAFALTAARALARLAVRGSDLQWAAVYANSKPRRLSLPTYPFEREHYELPLPPASIAPIAEHLSAPRAAAPEATPPPSNESLLWTVQWRPHATETPRAAAPLPTSWLLLVDELGVLAELTGLLRGIHARVITVRRGRTFRRLGGDAFSLDPADAGGFDALLRELDTDPGAALGIVFGWGLAAEGLVHDSLGSLERALECGPYALVDLVAAVGRHRPKAPISLAVLVNNAAAVATATEAVRPDAAALVSLMGVVRSEYGRWALGTFDLDVEGEEPSRAAERLFDELGRLRTADASPGNAPGLSVTAWRSGRRFLPQLSAIAAPAAATAAFREKGSYVIVGGKTGIGLELARHLRDRYGARVALISRRHSEGEPAPDSGETTPLWLEADVADFGAMQRALEQVRARFGRLHGVIHSAGVVRDRLLRDATREDLAAVLRPKVVGTWVLDQLTAADALETFVLFSSAATVFGPIGQAAHVMANGFQDGFAAYRRSAGRSALALDFGFWSETGYAARDRAVVERLEQRKIQGLTTREGLRCIETALSADASRVIAGRLSAALSPPPIEVAQRSSNSATEGTPAAAVVASIPNVDDVVDVLRQGVARALELPVDAVDAEMPVMELGLDSVRSAEFLLDASRRFGLELLPEIIFKHPTLTALAHYIRDHGGALSTRAIEPPKTIRPEPRPIASAGPSSAPPVPTAAGAVSRIPHEEDAIAIIGVAGRFPGADDVDGFWHELLLGRHHVRGLPDERRALGYAAADDPAREAFFGGYLDQVADFDPLCFGVAPRDAETMDPQQRLMLEVAYHALENAARGGPELAGSPTGVFIGATTGEFNDVIANSASKMDRAIGAGLAPSIIANRISYSFDLRGPSVLVDTACSSSLLAVHLACDALRRGDCTMAIAGGVNLLLSARRHRIVAAAGVLAPDDRCKTFARGADGYTRGEGAGAVVLKRYRAALADGDNIRAVILASTVNQDGLTNGISAPNPDAQRAVIESCWKRAGIEPSSIGFLEAHGTGTHIGDRIEIAAVAAAFDEHGVRRGSCAIGSVKTNIGHLEPAAGIAGLIKAALALEQRCLPPSLHFDEPNPDVDFASSPLFVNTHTRKWPEASTPRRAAVSAFGFGGTNCHLVLQESPLVTSVARRSSGPFVLALSARTATSLERLCGKTAEHLLRLEPEQVRDFCLSSNTGRRQHGLRLAVSGNDRASLVASLRAANAMAVRRPPRRFLALVPSDASAHETARVVLTAWGLPAERISATPSEPSAECSVADLRELFLKRPPGWETEAAVQLWNAGAALDWSAFYGAGSFQRLPLPLYPFDRKPFWPERAASEPKPAPPANEGAALAFRLEWQPAPELSGSPLAISGADPWWLIGADADEVAALRAALPAQRFEQLDPRELVDPDLIAARLRAEHPSHVVYSGAPTALASPELASTPLEISRLVQAHVEPFFLLAKAIAAWEPERLRVAVVTTGHAPLAPAEDSLAALVRAAARELRTSQVQLFRLETRDAAERVAALLTELGHAAASSELRWAADRRETPLLRPVTLTESPDAVAAQGVYLLIGGGKGIGAELALHLAKRAARLMIVGRSPASSAAALLERVAAAGGQAQYLQADAGSLAQMAEVFRATRRRWGRIDGVFHLAGVVDRDAFSLANKDLTAFRRVQRPKVDAAAVLAALAEHGTAPRFVMLFSSLASVSGAAAAGLGDYAAANGFLDGLVRQKVAAGARTRFITVNWSLWKQVGMGAAGNGLPLLDRVGAAPLATESALALLDAILASHESQLVVLGSNSHTELHPELLSESAPAPKVPALPAKAPATKAAAASPRGEIERFLLDTVARLLRSEPSELDPEASLVEYGIDSLILADLLATIEKQYGCVVEPAVILENPTLRGTATYLERAVRARGTTRGHGSTNGASAAAKDPHEPHGTARVGGN